MLYRLRYIDIHCDKGFVLIKVSENFYSIELVFTKLFQSRYEIILDNNLFNKKVMILSFILKGKAEMKNDV